ncbi:MAG: beta-lactamase family protein [Eubacteriales bacterium]|nr:beta-lactamase family protein [Eubacteriales bacterium]
MDFSKLTAYLDSLEQTYEVHGLDCKILRGHLTVYRHMAGHRDYAKREPVSEHDLYDVYSCTKVITMTAVMQLVEQGRLSLDEPLSRYLPEFSEMQVAKDFRFVDWPFAWPTLSSPLAPARNPILIHQLMSMTAGLSYDVLSEPIREMQRESGNRASTRDMMKAIARMPLICEPGTRYSYGLGHDVLAAVIEVIDGEPFSRYLKKHVFDPLGAADLYFHIPEREAKRLSAQYRKDMDTGEVAPYGEMIYRLTNRYESGGAGLACPVDAYSRVLDALANGGVGANGARILEPESIAAMSQNRLNAQQMQDFSRAGKAGYGYGLGVRTLVDAACSKSPVGEFGWDGAAGAYALVDPVNRLSIFYAHEIIGMNAAYSEIHPTIRDLAYEALELA